jgi:hypothetical protein
MAKEDRYALVKLPSGEVRMVLLKCKATIGQLGNVTHENVSIGKSGSEPMERSRPKVRGVAMNPVDHPMGGGEGRSSGGRHPCTPWGVPTKGIERGKTNAPIAISSNGEPNRSTDDPFNPHAGIQFRIEIRLSAGEIMPRSLKKGPYIDQKLLKKVSQLRVPVATRSSRHGRDVRPFCRKWSGLLSPCTMAGNLFPCS